MKRFIAFLLVLIMAMSLLSTAAFAASPASDFKFGAGCITQYTGKDRFLEIPETLGGRPVMGIGKKAFAFSVRLEGVTIPASVKYIAQGAFFNLRQLKFVKLKGTIISVGGEDVFAGVNADLILPNNWDTNRKPYVGTNVQWRGGTFHVMLEKDHICKEYSSYEQDHKCDICGKVISECVDTSRDGTCDICGRVMNGSNLNLGRNFRNPVVPAAKAAVRTAAAVGTAVAVTAAKAVRTTAIVVRSILKWF